MKNLIAELICTRISHDIIGNIGAVANASELLEEGDVDFLDDIKNILKLSSFNLTSRMKFFRMAFGVDNNNLNDLVLVKQICENYLKSLSHNDHAIECDFKINNCKTAKIAMVVLMIMADLPIRGGKITIEEINGMLAAKVNKNTRISEDKWANFQGVLQQDNACINANTAPLVWLVDELGNAKIKMVDDGVDYLLAIALEN